MICIVIVFYSCKRNVVLLLYIYITYVYTHIYIQGGELCSREITLRQLLVANYKAETDIADTIKNVSENGTHYSCMASNSILYYYMYVYILYIYTYIYIYICIFYPFISVTVMFFRVINSSHSLIAFDVNMRLLYVMFLLLLYIYIYKRINFEIVCVAKHHSIKLVI
jgi:hypothetical protein